MDFPHSGSFLCILFMVFLVYADVQQKQPVVPALFILGDSTVDCGNNNWLWTVAQAKFLPFGRDFDDHQPTGRFSNGRLSIDYLADFLNLPIVPPYLSKPNFDQGVNFASAGSGILNATGSVFGQRIPMIQQLEYLKLVKNKLEQKYGKQSATEIFTKSIFYISVGSNDIINNYLVPGSKYLRNYPRDAFIDLLISGFHQQLKELYQIGARRIVVASLSPLGSVPSQLAKFATMQTNGSMFLNTMAQVFNARLFNMLSDLRASLPQSDIIYNSLYNVLADITLNYQKYGFLHADSACCGLGNYNGSVPCLPNVPVCANASEYVFWDEYHPTQHAYKLIAEKLWAGNLNESYPVNVKTLLGL